MTVSIWKPAAALALALLLFPGLAAADDEGAKGTGDMASAQQRPSVPSHLVIKTSQNSVGVTIDRLSKAVESRGIRVIARVDHTKNAQTAGLELPPTQVLIFGNPKIGTPLMMSNRLIAIELPMKVLAWEEPDGTVKLAYTRPGALKERYGYKDRDEEFKKMAAALDELTTIAASGQ